MARSTASGWESLKSRFGTLPVFVRRSHRILGVLWLLSLALASAVSAGGGELPGPSIPGLSFVALIITGTYLLVRPWVQTDRTVADRWRRLTNWNVARPVLVRRIHRSFATVLLLLIGTALALETVSGVASSTVIVPIVGVLLGLVLTGAYMHLRPWVERLRAR